MKKEKKTSKSRRTVLVTSQTEFEKKDVMEAVVTHFELIGMNYVCLTKTYPGAAASPDIFQYDG